MAAPKIHRAYALNAMCRRPACRKMAENNRQYWPSAMRNGCIAPRRISVRSGGPWNSAFAPPTSSSSANTANSAASRNLVGGANALFQGPPERTLIRLGAMQPFLIADGQYWRLFSAIFLHAGLLHIAFNAYALWIFGAAMEQALGRTRFLWVFFVTGFLASAASYAFGPVESVGVGASGAIFGVFGAFIAYNYRRRDLAQAAANLRWALMLILLNALLTLGIRLIDWRAHLGGLVAGFAAGMVAEGWGDRRTRRMVLVGGFAAMVAIGVALVAWRTADIRALPIFERAVAFFSS